MPPSDKRVRPVEVRALEPYRIWLRYDDGAEGEVDLSYLAGDGVFVTVCGRFLALTSCR